MDIVAFDETDAQLRVAALTLAVSSRKDYTSTPELLSRARCFYEFIANRSAE